MNPNEKEKLARILGEVPDEVYFVKLHVPEEPGQPATFTYLENGIEKEQQIFLEN